MSQARKTEEKKIDRAVDMTFPASDSTAHGKPTGTEPPTRPADRQAPAITKEQIEQAQRGEGHKHDEWAATRRTDGLIDGNAVDHPDRKTVKVRQGTGPRAMVLVLFVSLMLAFVVGAALLAQFVLG